MHAADAPPPSGQSEPRGPRVRLGRNVAANLVTAAVSIAASLVAIPLILDDVGLAGYGVWTLGQSILFYVSSAEAGPGSAIQRFVAVRFGAGSLRGVAQVFWTTLALYAAVGVVLLGLVYALAPWFVGLFDIPERLEGEAIAMFRIMGLAIALALIVSMLGNVQQGLERFPAFAVSAMAGVVVFLAGVAVLVPAHGLVGLAWAVVAQQVAAALARGWNVRAATVAVRPQLMGAGDARRLASFAVQMQMSSLATVVNSQTDKVVVGLIAPIATVGHVGIGSQVAEAGRAVGGAALTPLSARMAVVHGGGDERELMTLYQRMNTLWTRTMLGATALGAAAVYPLIAAWLGGGHGEAALFGGLLVVAFGTALAPAIPLNYLRAVGRPQLEAHYGLVVIALNAVLTVTLALTVGAVGAVAATAAAYVLGVAWVYRRLREVAPELPAGAAATALRAAPAAAVTSALALGFGVAMIELLPPGLSLVPVGLAAGAAFVAYMSWATGVRPTPANARALLA